MVDLKKLDQRRAFLESKLAMTTAALKQAQRRDDTRRKVVVGAALFVAVRDGTLPKQILDVLVTKMAQRDAKLFDEIDVHSATRSEELGQ